MPSTYSPDLRIELIANGEQSGTWGATTNSNLGTLIEDAISGRAPVAVTSANQALTALNGAADESRCAAVDLSIGVWGSPSNFNVYVPPVTKLYVVRNTDATYTATVYCGQSITPPTNIIAAGTGIAIPPGKTVLLRSDGTNIIEQLDHVVGNFSVGGNATVTGNALITGTSTLGNALILGGSPGTSGQVVVSQGAGNPPVWGNAFVTGMIMMWSGTIATIPSGWALCNGSGGTPDLRDRFIVGASVDSGGQSVTTITGANTKTGGTKDAIVVAHTHTVGGVTVSTTTNLSGNVGFRALSSASGATGVFSAVSGGLFYVNGGSYGTNDVTMNANHSHTLSGSTDSTGSSGTNQNLPPYFALAFIMKL